MSGDRAVNPLFPELKPKFQLCAEHFFQYVRTNVALRTDCSVAVLNIENSIQTPKYYMKSSI